MKKFEFVKSEFTEEFFMRVEEIEFWGGIGSDTIKNPRPISSEKQVKELLKKKTDENEERRLVEEDCIVPPSQEKILELLDKVEKQIEEGKKEERTHDNEHAGWKVPFFGVEEIEIISSPSKDESDLVEKSEENSPVRRLSLESSPFGVRKKLFESSPVKIDLTANKKKRTTLETLDGAFGDDSFEVSSPVLSNNNNLAGFVRRTASERKKRTGEGKEKDDENEDQFLHESFLPPAKKNSNNEKRKEKKKKVAGEKKPMSAKEMFALARKLHNLPSSASSPNTTTRMVQSSPGVPIVFSSPSSEDLQKSKKKKK